MLKQYGHLIDKSPEDSLKRQYKILSLAEQLNRTNYKPIKKSRPLLILEVMSAHDTSYVIGGVSGRHSKAAVSARLDQVIAKRKQLINELLNAAKISLKSSKFTANEVAKIESELEKYQRADSNYIGELQAARRSGIFDRVVKMFMEEEAWNKYTRRDRDKLEDCLKSAKDIMGNTKDRDRKKCREGLLLDREQCFEWKELSQGRNELTAKLKNNCDLPLAVQVRLKVEDKDVWLQKSDVAIVGYRGLTTNKWKVSGRPKGERYRAHMTVCDPSQTFELDRSGSYYLCSSDDLPQAPDIIELHRAMGGAS